MLLKRLFQCQDDRVPPAESPPSARKAELLEASYAYVRVHGLTDLSLRPLATAIGSSPRVLLFLFGSKDGLVRALLTRARQEELELLEDLRGAQPSTDLDGAVIRLWDWLSAPERRDLLVLWVEGYARSLVDPNGPWAHFARQTVADWLDLLAIYQPARSRRSSAALAERTGALALLRGSLLDLLATGDRDRVTAALEDRITR
jgi:AcrR family transcriptional regulator